MGLGREGFLFGSIAAFAKSVKLGLVISQNRGTPI